MDDATRNLQEALFLCGHYPGEVDGMMGGNTKNAVRQFQESMGLAADGIAGPDTKAALVMKLAEASARATALMSEISE